MERLAHILGAVLDVLFPPSPSEARVRRMDYDELAVHMHVQNVPVLDNAVALFPYRNDLVRQAIWELKYRGNRSLARLFAAALADYLLDELADSSHFDHGPPIVVPIPLSFARRRERGWNQVELVATELLKILPSDIVHYNPKLLVRTKNTESQTKTRSKTEREQNLKNAFAVPEKVATPSSPVILLDDVITTGATLRSARDALLTAGAKEVRCVGLAH